MKRRGSDTAGVELTQLQVSFTLKPKNGRRNRAQQRVACRSVEAGNIPRISKLMALAIRLDELIRRGEVQDYAYLARLGHVTRARITQIMMLLNLAPDIQETLLFLPRTVKGHDLIRERDVRPIAAIPYWNRQRKMWLELHDERLK
ncbi:MAG: hypothetical protein KKG33_14205 [candidate division Zixibacteria bacterium]|nr:hypothetical protein [candidate division Zixibacteria bacterium]MBU1471608.1 hypothetical protein [candidate division Zixibacteria bacterium]MBU2626705.1 hypothetical protein [candidate division Zixibacteria bacterium]